MRPENVKGKPSLQCQRTISEGFRAWTEQSGRGHSLGTLAFPGRTAQDTPGRPRRRKAQHPSRALPDPNGRPGISVVRVWVSTEHESSLLQRESGSLLLALSVGTSLLVPPDPKIISYGGKLKGGAPSCREGRGTRREGALSPQVGIPGRPPIQGHHCSSKSSSRWGRKKEKLTAKVVWGRTSRAKRKEQSEGSACLEGGVHSPVEFYDFQCFVPLQFGADQVLLQLQQH